MISTKNLISSINDVNSEWIFEYYLNLAEKLSGQDVKMKSIFNKDEIPSMFLYCKDGTYKFKDFSSSNQGDGIELVKQMFNLATRNQAISRIISDYQQYVKSNKVQVSTIQKHDRWKVTDHEIRHWNNFDAQYWSEFNISSSILKEYNVAPLEYFTMEKELIDGSTKSIKFNKTYTYGYFREDGELYKIYMPKNVDKKFIKVQDYLQGTDQLKYDKKYLIITSSLKDLMVFRQLGIGNIETIAPDSENTIVPRNLLNKITSNYTKTFVLFDNDQPGINSMKKYQEMYGFDYIILDMEKDLSDSVKKYGIEKVRGTLLPLMKKLI